MNALTKYLNNKNKGLQISYLELRRAIGWLGLGLPVVLAIGTLLIGDCSIIKDSISDYYYTIMGCVLVGVLCGVALFLFSYKGFNNWDWISSNLAAVFALGVAFFPMVVKEGHRQCNILCRSNSPWRNWVHFGSAALFFITLACISIFLFTKTDKPHISKKKRARNKIYRACGIIMLVSIAVIASLQIYAVYEVLSPYKPTFVLETIALWAFGLSWLTKGEFLLKD